MPNSNSTPSGQRILRNRGWQRYRLTVLLFLSSVALLTGVLALMVHQHAGAAVRVKSSMQTSQGEQIYLSNCADCHGEHGEGAFQGPSLRGLPAGEDTIPGVVELVRDGVPDMDAFGGVLSEEEIQTVSEYVVSQFAIPGDIPTGGELYRLNCAACHGATLHGGALIYSDENAPQLLDVSAAHVVSAIRYGPGTMPTFNEAAFPDEQAAAVAAYVRAVQSPPTSGGLSLLYPGPVPEGFIAAVVGLGAAVLAALWVERGGRG